MTTVGHTTEGLRVRPAAVAGTFYPARASALVATVDAELDEAAAVAGTAAGSPRPKVLIVPHAGFVYSGPVAASAYVRLLPFHDTVRRVVLLGPAHRVPVRSMALSSADLWATPLGTVPVDSALRARAASLDGVVVDDAAHRLEHSLEVQVPFLQRVLDPGWSLLPVVVGDAHPDDVAALLDEVWGDDATLIVISSDLSHYHDASTARRRDRATAEAIVGGRIDDIGPYDACGAHPVRGALVAAARRGLRAELLDLRNSGDTAGPSDRVVGYGAFQLVPATRTGGPDATDGSTTTAGRAAADGDVGLSPAARRALLDIAEESIRAVLERRPPRLPDPATLPGSLRRPGACFVTLRDGDRLLGCIGSLHAHRALVDDAAENARSAAFDDPRLPALTPEEFARMSLHISVLTPPEALPARSFADLARRVRPHHDGLLVEAGRHRGTFLPSVWEQLPDVGLFLDQLWRKAGMAPGTWPADLRVWRYETVEFGDDGPRAPIR